MNRVLGRINAIQCEKGIVNKNVGEICSTVMKSVMNSLKNRINTLELNDQKPSTQVFELYRIFNEEMLLQNQTIQSWTIKRNC